MKKHLPKCERFTQKLQKMHEDWKARWPHHCPTCKGSGGQVSYEHHPYGSTTASEQLFDLCPACSELMVCPRCGVQFDEDEYNSFMAGERDCYACGWDVCDPDYCPDPPDYCCCDDAQLEADQLNREAKEELKELVQHWEEP